MNYSTILYFGFFYFGQLIAAQFDIFQIFKVNNKQRTQINQNKTLYLFSAMLQIFRSFKFPTVNPVNLYHQPLVARLDKLSVFFQNLALG